MRILVANDGFGDAGGVQTYLDAVVPALAARGHELAFFHLSSGLFHDAPIDQTGPVFKRISVTERGAGRALHDVQAWAPDVCYSHNMRDLDLERRLIGIAPVVKFMHGYFGTCIGGQKMRQFPAVTPCDKRFGPGCLALYLPCGCGRRDPIAMLRDYGWSRHQRSLFPEYSAVVVASGHMKREYVRNGVGAERVHVAPLFAREQFPSPAPAPSAPSLAFCGRMTTLKGGDVLIEATAAASRERGVPIPLVMIGDGPQRDVWQELACSLGVATRFTGWLTGEALWRELRGATLLAVPSTWPEPFGLVGLEAGAHGVPAIAFDVGGVREWLQPGENGYLVPGDPPRASAFAGVLIQALDDPATATRMREAARRVAREMSLASHVDRLEGILLAQRDTVAR